MGQKLSKNQAAHLKELVSLVRKANLVLKEKGKTIFPLTQQDLTLFLLYLGKECPTYPEEGKLDLETWRRLGSHLLKPPRAPGSILLTWKALMAMLNLLDETTSFSSPTAPPRYEELPSDAKAHSEVPSPQTEFPPPPPATDFPPPPAEPDAMLDSTFVLSPLAEGVLKARQEGLLALDDLIDVSQCSAYPVALVDDPARPRQKIRGHVPIDYKTIKNLKDAVTDYGIQSHYVQTLFRAFATNYEVIPQDWKDFGAMILTTAQYVIFDTHWKRGVRAAVAAGGLPATITADHLLGEGNMATIAQQVTAPRELYPHLNEIILRALSKLEDNKSVRSSFASVKQGPQEPYSEFINRLTQAISRQIDNAAAQVELINKLAVENANIDCKKILGPLATNPEMKLSDFLEACKKQGLPHIRWNC